MAKYEFETEKEIEHCRDCPMFCYDEFDYGDDCYLNNVEFYCRLNKDITSGMLSISDDVWCDDLPNKEQCPLKRLA